VSERAFASAASYISNRAFSVGPQLATALAHPLQAQTLNRALLRPGHAPGDLLKLLIYGYLNRVRSNKSTNWRKTPRNAARLSRGKSATVSDVGPQAAKQPDDLEVIATRARAVG